MTLLTRKTKCYIMIGPMALLGMISWVACGASATHVVTPTPMPEVVPTQAPSPQVEGIPTLTPEPTPGILPGYTPSPTGDREMTGEEKVVRGSVVENNLGCHVNARCFLRLRLNEGEILVIYHYGEWPACLNEEAASQGEKLEEGDEVEVFGAYGEQGDKGTITTCDSTEYYIRKIQP